MVEQILQEKPMMVDEDNYSDYSTGSDSSTGSSNSSGNLIERNEISKNFLHLLLLLQKTFWQFARNKKNIVGNLLCPIVFNLMMFYCNSLEPMMAERRPIEGMYHDLTPVEKCYGQNCVSIGYSIIGDPILSDQYSWIDDIMQSVA